MASGSTTQWASQMTAWYEPTFVKAVFREANDAFLGYVVPGAGPVFPVSSASARQHSWQVNSAANTSAEVFTEGAAQPVAVAQTYVTPAISPLYFRAMVRVTGHSRDIHTLQHGAVFDLIQAEFDLGKEDVIDLMTTTFMGTGANGIQNAIAATGTYAGIARGSATYFESTATALSGVLTVDALMDLKRTIRDANKGGKVGLWVMPVNQLQNYQQLVGAPNATNATVNSIRWNASNGGPTGMDLIPVDALTTVAGLPVLTVATDFTNTVILAMDITPGYWKYKQWRAFQVRADQSGDDDVYQLSSAGTIVCENPVTQGKLTAVTA